MTSARGFQPETFQSCRPSATPHKRGRHPEGDEPDPLLHHKHRESTESNLPVQPSCPDPADQLLLVPDRRSLLYPTEPPRGRASPRVQAAQPHRVDSGRSPSHRSAGPGDAASPAPPDKVERIF